MRPLTVETLYETTRMGQGLPDPVEGVGEGRIARSVVQNLSAPRGDRQKVAEIMNKASDRCLIIPIEGRSEAFACSL
jgi:hypothetical protein